MALPMTKGAIASRRPAVSIRSLPCGVSWRRPSLIGCLRS